MGVTSMICAGCGRSHASGKNTTPRAVLVIKCEAWREPFDHTVASALSSPAKLRSHFSLSSQNLKLGRETKRNVSMKREGEKSGERRLFIC